MDRCLNLALQGGGAHGAFTWGVLDALLDEPSIDFEALSGSSAGAVNAVVMTQGWIQGGRAGARAALSNFWLEVGQQIPWPMVAQGHGESMSLTAATRVLTQWMGMFAPGQLNPLGLNPLRDVLKNHIDFESIRSSSPFRLFVGATHVNTGKLRLFREHELQLDMLLASACLPRIHHTVVIDGEPYWDGGYSANPALFPLLHDSRCHDLLLILLAPQLQDDVGQSVEAISSRIQDLGFTTHFLREMQMLAYLASRKNLGDVNQARFHMIDAGNLEAMRRNETKMLAYGPFLEILRDCGRERAQQWLSENIHSIGQRSTLDWSQWAVD
jgi:NTE family protein